MPRRLVAVKKYLNEMNSTLQKKLMRNIKRAQRNLKKY